MGADCSVKVITSVERERNVDERTNQHKRCGRRRGSRLSAARAGRAACCPRLGPAPRAPKLGPSFREEQAPRSPQLLATADSIPPTRASLVAPSNCAAPAQAHCACASSNCLQRCAAPRCRSLRQACLCVSERARMATAPRRDGKNTQPVGTPRVRRAPPSSRTTRCTSNKQLACFRPCIWPRRRARVWPARRTAEHPRRARPS